MEGVKKGHFLGLKRARWPLRSGGEEGLTLIETLVAVGILGFIGVGFMVAASTVFLNSDMAEERVSAENLVRAQLEYIRGQAYFIPPSVPYSIPPGADPGAYSVPPPGVTPPSEYSLSVEIDEYCDGLGPEPGGCYDIAQMQKITGSVSRAGELITRVSDLKTKR